MVTFEEWNRIQSAAQEGNISLSGKIRGQGEAIVTETQLIWAN